MDLTIASTQVRAMIAAFADLGLPVDTLREQVGWTRAQIDDPDARLGEVELLQFWLASERAWGDATVGLRAGSRLPFGAFELLDYLVSTATTMRAAFGQIARYAAIASDSVTYSIADGDPQNDVVVTLHHPYLGLMPPGMVEYLCALLATRFRDYGNEHFRPAVHLGHAPLGSVSLYRELLGEVVFESAAPALRISPAQWNLPFHPTSGARPARLDERRDGLAEVLARHARDVIARIPREPVDPLEPIRAAMTASLPNALDLPALAAKAGMTVRTLQRLFSRAETTYQEELDRIRRSLACTYLTSSALSSKEIAYLLGYTEPSAFNRAFKRWTSLTPMAYRTRPPPTE